MATYGLRFWFEFISQPHIGVGAPAPVLYRVNLHLRDYSGSPLEITAYADGVATLGKVGSDADVFTPLHPTVARFKLRCTTEWDATSLFVNDDRTLKVEVLRDATLTGTDYAPFWYGWALPTEFSEAYRKKPYDVELTAGCGIATLKERYLLDSAGKRLNGKVSLSHILRAALALTDFSLPLITGLNRYERYEMEPARLISGNPNPNTDPLFQAMLDAESLILDEGSTETAYSALERVCRSMGLRLGQHNAEWWAIYARDAAGGFDIWTGSPRTIRTRSYAGSDPASPPLPGSSVSRDMSIVLQPQTEFAVLHASNARLRMRHYSSGVRVEFPYGRSRNKIPNGDLSQVDGTGLPTGFIRYDTSASQSFRGGSGTEVDPYYLQINGYETDERLTGIAGVEIRIDYPVDGPEWKRFIKRRLTFDFALQTDSAAKIVIIAERESAGKPWLFVDNDYVLLPSRTAAQDKGLLLNHSTEILGEIVPNPGWARADIDLGTIDKLKRLRIILLRGLGVRGLNGQIKTSPAPWIRYKNLRLTADDAQSYLTGASRERVRENRSKPPTVLTMSMGDLPYYAGRDDKLSSLYQRGTGLPVASFHLPGNPNLEAGTSLIDLRTDDYASQALLATPGFTATVTGDLPYGLHTIVRVFDVNAGADTLALVDYSHDLRTAQTAISGVLVRPTNPAGLPPLKRFWQTPNGEIPADPSGTAPSETPPKRPIEDILRDPTKLIGDIQFPIGNVPSDTIPLSPNQQRATKFKVSVKKDGRLLGVLGAILRKKLGLPTLPP